MRAKLPPLRLNQYGGIAEWMEDFEEVFPAPYPYTPLSIAVNLARSHAWLTPFRLQANPGNGHVSHLVPLYPLNHITSANATLFQAAATSLEHRLA
jgi:hypothetical protein